MTLPDELLWNILWWTGRYTYPSAALTSKRISRIIQPLLYRTWTYGEPGAPESFFRQVGDGLVRKVDLFIRTLIERPDLASYVKIVFLNAIWCPVRPRALDNGKSATPPAELKAMLAAASRFRPWDCGDWLRAIEAGASDDARVA